MEFRGIPDPMLDRPLTDFALTEDAAIDALHARALAGDAEAVHRLYLGMVAHLAGSGAQRARARLTAFSQRMQRSRGGRTRAERHRAKPLPPWMVDLFDEAFRQCEVDLSKPPGHGHLLGAAWRLAGRDHPQRDAMTEHRARQYLKTRTKTPL